jgi:lipooligosaccharide transport system permease protein
MQMIVNLLPLTHAVELIRPLIAGTEMQNIPLHIAVLGIYALGFYYLSVVMVRKKLIV